MKKNNEIDCPIEEPYSCSKYKKQTWENCHECCITSIKKITEYLLKLKKAEE